MIQPEGVAQDVFAVQDSDFIHLDLLTEVDEGILQRCCAFQKHCRIVDVRPRTRAITIVVFVLHVTGTCFELETARAATLSCTW